ncbi:MAG: hypothetical protein KDA27_27400, partial [Candidatus Eisenbacteria bacterium]|nr:hypothetical protein [Candidatus Eisenbacteria bacterium]
MQRVHWRPILLILLTLLGVVGLTARAEDATAPPDGTEMLEEALTRLGLDLTDLGYRPRGSWTRFPLPETVPYLNPAFEDLFARPQVLPRYVHGMADPVRRFLDPEKTAAKD